MPIHLLHFVSTGYIIIQNGKLSNILTGMYNYWTFRLSARRTPFSGKEKNVTGGLGKKGLEVFPTFAERRAFAAEFSFKCRSGKPITRLIRSDHVADRVRSRG